MMNKSKKIGNEYESKLIDILGSKGWWCHLFAYKPEGQPCDVIAIKNNVPFLIDVKHCNEKSFPFRDIQPNQKTCFELAHRRGNNLTGFAIYFEEGGWRWLGYGMFKLCELEGMKSVRYEKLMPLFEKIDELTED